MNGRGTPVAGSIELATEMLINACKQIETVIPAAKSLPNTSSHLFETNKPLCKKARNKPIIKKVEIPINKPVKL
jgi:hypothetical protein